MSDITAVCQSMIDVSTYPIKQRSTKELMEFAERHSKQLREIAGIAVTERLDPLQLALHFGLKIIDVEQLTKLSPQDRLVINELTARSWSGGAQPMPDGSLLIILNPNQTPERRTVTLMEEIAHLYLAHPPSHLRSGANGLWERTYNKSIEDEAYWTAAAALLPRQVIGKAVWERCLSTDISQKFGVSIELVEFRIKTLNLWRSYSEYFSEKDTSTQITN